MHERCKRWIVFSIKECGFSFKESRNREYECGMCKLQVMIKSGRRKIMELNEIVSFSGWAREGGNVEVKVRSLREEVDWLKEKVEEVRNKVSVRLQKEVEVRMG